jgi:hypothetical protein
MNKIVFTIVIIGLLAGCGEIYRYSESGQVGWALKKAIRDEHKPEVRLKELTRFDWDEFFLFDPYTPTAEICKELSLNASKCKDTIKPESTDDGEMLLVFRNIGKVVHLVFGLEPAEQNKAMLLKQFIWSENWALKISGCTESIWETHYTPS